MLKGFLENVDEKLTDGEYRHLFSYKKSPVKIGSKMLANSGGQRAPNSAPKLA